MLLPWFGIFVWTVLSHVEFILIVRKWKKSSPNCRRFLQFWPRTINGPAVSWTSGNFSLIFALIILTLKRENWQGSPLLIPLHEIHLFKRWPFTNLSFEHVFFIQQVIPLVEYLSWFAYTTKFGLAATKLYLQFTATCLPVHLAPEGQALFCKLLIVKE